MVLDENPIFKALMEFPVAIRGQLAEVYIDAETGQKASVPKIEGLASRLAGSVTRSDMTRHLLNRTASEPELAKKFGTSPENIKLALDYLALARQL